MAEPGTIAELAAVQVVLRESRMRAFEAKREALSADPEHRFHRLTLELGMRDEQAAIDFWRELARNPPA